MKKQCKNCHKIRIIIEDKDSLKRQKIMLKKGE